MIANQMQYGHKKNTPQKPKKFGHPKKIAIIILKFQQYGFTME